MGSIDFTHVGLTYFNQFVVFWENVKNRLVMCIVAMGSHMSVTATMRQTQDTK